MVFMNNSLDGAACVKQAFGCDVGDMRIFLGCE
jgi:hypothetical protein